MNETSAITVDKEYEREEDRKKFLLIRNQILEEIKLTEDNIHKKVLKAPMLASRYSSLLIKEQRILHNLEGQKNKVYKRLVIHYKQPKNNLLIETKSDLETFVLGHDNYVNINKLCNEHKIRVDFYKEHIAMFKNLSYIYSSYVEYKKLKEGSC